MDLVNGRVQRKRFDDARSARVAASRKCDPAHRSSPSDSSGLRWKAVAEPLRKSAPLTRPLGDVENRVAYLDIA